MSEEDFIVFPKPPKGKPDAPPKKRRKGVTDRQLVYRKGQRAIVAAVWGKFSRWWLDSSSNCADDWDGLPPEDGWWIWRGRITVDQWEYEYDYVFHGTWRKPTEHEMKYALSQEDIDYEFSTWD